MHDPHPLPPFHLEVYFSGLVFFVSKRLGSDGPIKEVTHAVLRDGREGHHDHYLGLRSGDEAKAHSEISRNDFKHDARVDYICEDGKPGEGARLEDHWVYFEWRNPDGKIVIHSGADAYGSPEDVKDHLPTAHTASSFYWVPSVLELGPKNAVLEDCYDHSEQKPGVVACVPLAGGLLKTSVFAWAHKFKPKGNCDRVEKERWIPRLRFCPDHELFAPMDRAAAEGVTWVVKAPHGATKLYIYKAKFEQSTALEPIMDFNVKAGKKALVGITNYSAKRGTQDNEIHPGRDHEYGSLHFEMYYDLLQGPVSPGVRYIPWIPGCFMGAPEWRKNAMRYEDLEGCRCPLDVGKERTAQEVPYESAAEAFAKDDRPLCVSGGGSG